VSDYEYQLKFVVQNPDDIMEIRDLVEQLQADINRVVLMPEGTDPVLLRQKSLWLVELCKQEGYRFSPRLQIDLYGNRRGF
jgi:7-carboxy-7-deazaguanine synthase